MMKKLLLLSLINLFACNTQVFSMESKNEIIEKEVCSQPNTGFVEDKKDSTEGENYEKLCDCYYSLFKEDPIGEKKSTLLNSFEAWAITIIREELKETNPEIFKNIDCLIYYLLGAAKQIKGKNSGWTSIKGWKNTFSDYMKGITTGNITLNDYMHMSIPGPFPRISLHKMLDVFIDIFSLSSNNEENKRKEIMKRFFRYKLRQSINEMPKEKGYSKSNISSIKDAEDVKYGDEENYMFSLEYGSHILLSFIQFDWLWRKIRELEKTNPEIFENVDYLVYYLLGSAKQIKKQNKWQDTFSHYMHKSTRSDLKIEPRVFGSSCTFHDTLDIFIETFSSNSSDKIEINKCEIKKGIFRKPFKYQLCRHVDSLKIHKYTDEEKGWV